MYYDLVVYKRKVNQTCVYFMGYILLSDISIAMHNRTIPSTVNSTISFTMTGPNDAIPIDAIKVFVSMSARYQAHIHNIFVIHFVEWVRVQTTNCLEENTVTKCGRSQVCILITIF